MTSAVILLSRQPLRPDGKTEWIVQVQKGIAFCRAHGYRLLGSHGMQTWELVTAVGSMQKLPMRIISISDKRPLEERHSWLTREFELDRELTEIIELAGVSSNAPEKDLMHARDKQIIDTADILIPISIRQNGAMMKLMEKARSNGKEIIDDFRCEYLDRKHSLAYRIEPNEIKPELSELSVGYLFHWTRATNSAWPEERLIDYYRAIIDSEKYPRTALDALQRILATKTVISSGNHMPGRIPTVSFTALTPEETAPLMRWRARYSQMSIEPYGIGIAADACASIGILPVQYYDHNDSISRNAEDFWLSQSVGMITDWRQEKEYRHRGDLSLDKLPPDQMIVVCRTHEEAREIEARFRVKAIAFCRG